MTAQEIKALRESLGETQEQFAERFGVVRTTVTMWEINGTPETGPGRYHVDGIIAKLRGNNGLDNGTDRPTERTSRA